MKAGTWAGLPGVVEAEEHGALAVVLAGGLGTRFGGTKPKQLVEINGYPVLWHTLTRFVRSEIFSHCVIVANSDWFGPIDEIVQSVATGVPTVLVSGGRSRNESVRNGIMALELADSTKCLIHDGVRPLVTEKLIRSVLDALDCGKSVIPIIDSVDPLVRVYDGRVDSIESREAVFRGQSPQGFNLGMLRRVFDQAGIPRLNAHSTIFDVLREVDPYAEILTVSGEKDNLKITQPIDHVIAEELLAKDQI